MQLFNSKQSALLFFAQFFAPFSLPRIPLVQIVLRVCTKHIRPVSFLFLFLAFFLSWRARGGGGLAVSALYVFDVVEPELS
jgi:hypothetical protein